MSKIQKILLWTIVSLCLALVLVFIINYDSILTKIGNFLIVNEKPQKADVIIVLNGSDDRVPYAAELYQLGYAGKVLLSGDDSYMTQQALASGIPQSALLLENQSKTTFENARYSLKIVQDQGYKSAIVVTSAYHTRRAGIIFDQFFKGIRLTICAVPYPYDLSMGQSWWKNRYTTGFVATEYLKLVWHYLFEWH